MSCPKLNLGFLENVQNSSKHFAGEFLKFTKYYVSRFLENILKIREKEVKTFDNNWMVLVNEFFHIYLLLILASKAPPNKYFKASGVIFLDIL